MRATWLLSTRAKSDEVYLPASRLHGVVSCSILALACFAFAAWLATLVFGQSHLPSKAGAPIAALFIGGVAVLGAYGARCAFRAAKSGVAVNSWGITVHNVTKDIRIAWPDIAQFDTMSDQANTGGAIPPSVNPYVVARVNLRDGRSRWIEGTRRGGPIWRREQRSEEVSRCVARLNRLLADATSHTPARRLTVGEPGDRDRTAVSGHSEWSHL
jgi:hypothetical protein